MEPLFFFFAALFLLLPLPLCVFLLVKRSKDGKRIQNLEQDVAYLTKKFYRQKHTDSPADPIAETVPESDESEETPTASPAVALDSPDPEESAQVSDPPPLSSDYNIVFEDSPAEEDKAVAREPIEESAETPSKVFSPIAFLRSIGLWPPEDAATAEAGMMQWWLPRLGGLLATLAVISFAVYISQGTPPWVRFAELVVADIAVIGLGVYFLKRRPRFGANLLSTGLSMAYLSSIAAYAAAPVRVIESPVLGILLQFAVIIATFTISLRLANRNIAIAALVYGFASSLYSAYLGLHESSLISALALYLVGIFFSHRFKWLPILTLSTVGAYLPALSFCVLKLIGSTTLTLPHPWSVLAALMISVSLLPLCEIKWNLAKSLNAFKRLHILNTSLCLGIGYVYMEFFTNELVLFYGTAAIVFSVWTAIFSRQGLDSTLFQLFFLKASALAALWLTNRFAGDIRWFALILEAAMIAWVALRSRSRLQEIASIALWITSHWIAYHALGFEKREVGSFTWFLFLSLPIIAAATLAALGKGLNDTPLRRYGYRALAVLNGLAGLRFITASDIAGDAVPMAMALYGGLICLLCLIPLFGNAIPAISGALLVFLANTMYWDNPYSDLSFAVVSLLAVAVAWGVSKIHSKPARRTTLTVELIFHATWITSAYAFLANAFASYAWFAFIPALFSIALLWAPIGSFRALRDASLIPLALFALFHSFNVDLGNLGIWIGTASYLGVLFLPNLQPKTIRAFRFFRRKHSWLFLHHLLVGYIVASLALSTEDWLVRIGLLLLSAIAFHLLWKGHRRWIGLAISFGMQMLALLSIAVIWSDDFASLFALDAQPWAKEALIGGLLLAVVSIGIGIDYSRSPNRFLPPSVRVFSISLAAIIGYASYVLTLSTDSLWNESAFTALVALFCLLLMGIGIGAKIKPYRMIALVGFTLPLTRLFVYDIRDTLIRIVAFAVLAALFIFIGYLYHRFQSRIE